LFDNLGKLLSIGCRASLYKAIELEPSSEEGFSQMERYSGSILLQFLGYINSFFLTTLAILLNRKH